MSRTSAIIPAAGRGKRFGKETNKVFALAAGKPLLAHTLEAFEKCGLIDEIILVVGEHEIAEAESIAEAYKISKIKAVVAGGGHRQDSVKNGLQAVDTSTDIVAIHDGARPLVSREVIEKAIAAARETGASVVAAPVVDTIKSAGTDGIVAATLDRSRLWAIQTPQTFDRTLLLRAYEQAGVDGYYGTDDASLVERLGHPVKIVHGAYDNIKVTTQLDLEFVEMRLGGKVTEEIRTGMGYDIHRFEAGRKLFLGGVEFPGEVGLAGHSDADVILHAIADALLGAAALGDIGRHFPDTDSQYKGISSILLLEQTAKVLSEAGWEVVNIDATLIAERPRIAVRVPDMQSKIASVLETDPERISIKATTAEKIGDIGVGAGAACHAVATVRAR